MNRAKYIDLATALLADLELEEVPVERVESITLEATEYTVAYVEIGPPFVHRTITRRVGP